MAATAVTGWAMMMDGGVARGLDFSEMAVIYLLASNRQVETDAGGSSLTQHWDLYRSENENKMCYCRLWGP